MKQLSKFEELSYFLDVKEAMILLKEKILNESEEANLLRKWKTDVENEVDLSESERKILIGQIIYLNAEVYIRSGE